jgi:hypothetical protein
MFFLDFRKYINGSNQSVSPLLYRSLTENVEILLIDEEELSKKLKVWPNLYSEMEMIG